MGLNWLRIYLDFRVISLVPVYQNLKIHKLDREHNILQM